MEAKRIGSLLIVGLVVLSVMLVVIGTAAARDRPIIFNGRITGMSGDGSGVSVVIEGDRHTWEVKTGYGGYYTTDKATDLLPGHYVMTLTKDSNVVELERDISERSEGVVCYTGECENCYCRCEWNYHTEIPEFSTIAIPIASILGLLFFFNRRKYRKE